MERAQFAAVRESSQRPSEVGAMYHPHYTGDEPEAQRS